jgi:membrane-bound lytic murein transglycosylase A
LNQRIRRALSQALIFSVSLAILAAVVVFSGILPGGRMYSENDLYGEPEFAFEAVDFDAIEGWSVDNQNEALQVFLRSCSRIIGLDPAAPANPKEALGEDFGGVSFSGVAADWQAICADAERLAAAHPENPADAAASARAFFQAAFQPLRVRARRKPKPEGPARGRRARISRTGLVTGYFEPVYPAELGPSPTRPAPLLARPADLVMVDLGEFREEFAGQRIAGLVADGALKPYPDHRAINAGALGARALPIAYLDPDDLFFLQIQGSGRLRFPDGSERRIGYDGQNGRPYTAIGKTLIDRGALTKENVSMQSIRAWLASASADEARALRETNQSYVFFRPLDHLPDPALGPLGSEGAQLTPMRSIAVDRRFHAFGAPVWLKLSRPGGAPIERLFIAQDEGGAIKGPIRADIFVGAGDDAGALAGELKADAEMFVLLPKPAAARLFARKGRSR